MVFEGKFNAPVFVSFLQRLLKQVAGKVYLIVDGHPVRKSGKARALQSPTRRGVA